MKYALGKSTILLCVVMSDMKEKSCVCVWIALQHLHKLIHWKTICWRAEVCINGIEVNTGGWKTGVWIAAVKSLLFPENYSKHSSQRLIQAQ